jgi:hypothetical protein
MIPPDKAAINARMLIVYHVNSQLPFPSNPDLLEHVRRGAIKELQKRRRLESIPLQELFPDRFRFYQAQAQHQGFR